MGKVYRARDTQLKRTVAIKVLSEHGPESVARLRFEREAANTAILSHPHIVALHDIGQEDGIDYLVMEYLEGETLAHRLNTGPLPLEDFLQYAIEIAEVIDYAHSRGIVHCDLKPANIMLTRSGTKMLDFGLATAFDEDALGGTRSYMAPEQLQEPHANVTTDVFAFGTVLLEMVMGHGAIKNRSKILARPTAIAPADTTDLQARTLDRIIRTCLNDDPHNRWQSARDLVLLLKWIAQPLSWFNPLHNGVRSSRKRQQFFQKSNHRVIGGRVYSHSWPGSVVR